MKHLFLIILFSATVARAQLINLTPGGFNENNAPAIFYWLLNTQNQVAGGNFFDPDSPKTFTWSPFEPLGERNFFVIRTDVRRAMVGWHLNNTPYTAQYVLVEGENGYANIYQSDNFQVTHNAGHVLNGSPIQAIIFYGSGPFMKLNQPMKTWIQRKHGN